jgi:hypothetical protein
MIFCRIVLGVVIYVLTVIWGIAAGPRLEVCFFSTGQGNCIAVRNDVFDSDNDVKPKLTFIDCGCAIKEKNHYRSILLDSLEYPGKKLESLFKGVSECEVLITHNHQDHTNLVELIAEIGKRNGCTVLNPIEPISSTKVFPRKKKRKKKLLEKGVASKKLEDDWNNFCRILPRIKSSLGSYTRVVPMRPERWQDNRAQSPEHDFNVIYLIDFSGRKIIFLGDVSPQLFTQIKNIPKYRREIDAADFWVLSHHGTNQAGELLEYKGNSEMYMICSDPAGENNLPWKDIRSLSFKSRKDGIIVRKHNVSARKEPTTGKDNVETLEEEIPVFVTCDAAQGYYELVIEADGTTRLYDGPTAKRDNNFCFQSL